MSAYHKNPEWAIEIPDFLPPRNPKDWLKIAGIVVGMLGFITVLLRISWLLFMQ